MNVHNNGHQLLYDYEIKHISGKSTRGELLANNRHHLAHMLTELYLATDPAKQITVWYGYTCGDEYFTINYPENPFTIVETDQDGVPLSELWDIESEHP